MFEIDKEKFDAINQTRSCYEKYDIAGIPESAIIGYGIKYFRTFEQDGKYYYDYETYSSCD